MRLVLDVENSVTWRDGKIFNDPFEPTNTLTQVLSRGRPILSLPVLISPIFCHKIKL